MTDGTRLMFESYGWTVRGNTATTYSPRTGRTIIYTEQNRRTNNSNVVQPSAEGSKKVATETQHD